MTPQQLLYLVRGVVILLVVVAIAWSGHRLVAFIQAPVVAERDAAVGANRASKAANDAQSAAIAALHDDGEKRKAVSAAAVKKAGEREYRKAKAVQEKPAPGATPLERAANRINAEFGR